MAQPKAYLYLGILHATFLFLIFIVWPYLIRLLGQLRKWDPEHIKILLNAKFCLIFPLVGIEIIFWLNRLF